MGPSQRGEPEWSLGHFRDEQNHTRKCGILSSWISSYNVIYNIYTYIHIYIYTHIYIYGSIMFYLYHGFVM